MKLKYKDLNADLKSLVEDTYGNVTRSQNPTVTHILTTLTRGKTRKATNPIAKGRAVTIFGSSPESVGQKDTFSPWIFKLQASQPQRIL